MKLPVRRWHPEKGEPYYVPGQRTPSVWEGDSADNALYKDGYVYQTKELAQKAEKALKSLRDTLPKHIALEFPRYKWEHRKDAPGVFRTMSPAACAYWLNEHQEWRQLGVEEMPLSGKELGVLIDRIIELLIQHECMYEV